MSDMGFSVLAADERGWRGSEHQNDLGKGEQPLKCPLADLRLSAAELATQVEYS